MKTLIIDALEALTDAMEEHAAEIGISAANISRIYSPEAFVTNLTEGENHLVVYFQNDVEFDREEMTIGIIEKIPVRIAILRKIGAITNGNIDPAVTVYEKLQNILCFEEIQFEGEKASYLLESAEPATVADPQYLDEMLVVFSAIDAKIQAVNTYAERDPQTNTAGTVTPEPEPGTQTEPGGDPEPGTEPEPEPGDEPGTQTETEPETDTQEEENAE